MCKHPIDKLIGTADGITCQHCGKHFVNFDAVLADREPEAAPAPEAVPEKPKRSRKKKEAE